MATRREIGDSTTVNNWQWQSEHVERKLRQGEYVSAESVLIAAGPPRFDQVAFQGSTLGESNDGAAGDNTTKGGVYPIGLIENFGISQNKQLQRLFEIGAKRSYFIPGRTMSSLNMGRVLFWGPSLMRVLYAYYPGIKVPMADGISLEEADDGVGINGNHDEAPDIKLAPGGVAGEGVGRKASFFINLASDLFNQPLGLMCYLKDARDQVYGAFYLEDVFLQAHQFNINSSSVLIAEGVAAQFDVVVPVDVDGASG